jgi:hypothetical protein
MTQVDVYRSPDIKDTLEGCIAAINEEVTNKDKGHNVPNGFEDHVLISSEYMDITKELNNILIFLDDFHRQPINQLLMKKHRQVKKIKEQLNQITTRVQTHTLPSFKKINKYYQRTIWNVRKLNLKLLSEALLSLEDAYLVIIDLYEQKQSKLHQKLEIVDPVDPVDR